MIFQKYKSAIGYLESSYCRHTLDSYRLPIRTRKRLRHIPGSFFLLISRSRRPLTWKNSGTLYVRSRPIDCCWSRSLWYLSPVLFLSVLPAAYFLRLRKVHSHQARQGPRQQERWICAQIGRRLTEGRAV